MTFYKDMQNITSDILSEFQQGSVKLIKITPGSGPADNPGPSTEQEYELNAAVNGVSFKFVSAGFAVESDLQVIASVLEGVTVNPCDQIEIDGLRYKIISDRSTPAAGVKVAWKFIVRKGS